MGRLRLPTINERLPLFVTLAAAAVFGALKFSYAVLNDVHATWLFGLFGLALVVAVAFRRLSYEGLSPAFNILLRGIAASVGLYALIAYPSFDPVTHPDHQVAIVALEFARYAAVLCAVLAMFRPTFAVVVCVFVLLTKDISRNVLGLPSLTRTDYLPVVELGIFLVLCLVLFDCLQRLHRYRPLPDWLGLSMEQPAARSEVSLVAFFVAVSVHFGNYFYSALAKYVLDGGVFDWVVNNVTPLLILVTLEARSLPIGHDPAFTLRLFDSYSDVFVLSNVAILIGQTICVVAIWRVSWAMWLTLFYDLTHVVIFVVTGIFFWKWILLNLFIVLAFRSIRSYVVPTWLRLYSSLVVVLGTFVFFAAWLGWYDTNALVDHYFVAEDDRGDRTRVPSNYFLTGSVTAAQQRLGTLTTDQFPVRTWATTRSSAVREQAAAGCDFGAGPFEPVTRGDLDWLSSYVRKHHQYIVSRADTEGRYAYDLYPHHIFSNPLMSKDFNALDKRRIRKYIYTVESICLGAEEQQLTRQTFTRHEFEIDIGD